MNNTISHILSSFKTIVSENNVNKLINCAIAIDISGSTASSIYVSGGINCMVLQKEIEIAKAIIESHPQNKYTLYTFHSDCDSHEIKISPEGKILEFPYLYPRGCTDTHLVFNAISKQTVLPELIIVITDGQTNSERNDIKKSVNFCKERNIRIELIAVTNYEFDFNTISQSEEMSLPGMDLLDYLDGNFNKLEIYNPAHFSEPYLGATNSKLTAKTLNFMGHKIFGIIPDFLNELITELKKRKQITWTKTEYKLFLVEIGKLLSALFVEFPENDALVEELIKIAWNLKENSSVKTIEQIRQAIMYGFVCVTKGKPILMTNFDGHAKDCTVKHNEFANAAYELRSYGTPLNQQKVITVPYSENALCIIRDVDKSFAPTKPLGQYPNSLDKFDNVYFGIDANPQAIRIAMREFCEYENFYNARHSPNVIFYIANVMSMMVIQGHELKSDHLVELRKLAIAQTSMETMIDAQKYSGIGLYDQWKTGKIPPMHYTTSTTHTSLYKDIKINPFKLSEPVWWALMMTMLGLFNEQLSTYESALSGLNIPASEAAFIEYLRKTYAHLTTGSIKCLHQKTVPNSVFTLEAFEPTDKVFYLKPHGQCRTNAHYSAEEKDSYVMHKGCVWCKYIPSESDFLEVVNDSCADDVLRTHLRATIPPKVTNGIGAPLATRTLPQHMALQRQNRMPVKANGTSGLRSSHMPFKCLMDHFNEAAAVQEPENNPFPTLYIYPSLGK